MNVAILATAGQLAARGVEVDLITRAEAEPAVTRLLPGVTLREIAAGPRGPLRKDELAEVADAFGEEVAKLTGRGTPRYDLIHAHYWLSGLATLPVAIELGIPFVQSFHTLGVMKNLVLAGTPSAESQARIRSEGFLASQASAIVAASTAEVISLIDDVGAPPDRLWVVPPGVDLDVFAPGRGEGGARIRQHLGLEPDRPIVAVVGRIQPIKGQDLAIRALAELQAIRGSVPLLVIVGEPTPGDEGFARQLHALAAELGVADDVRFVGALKRELLAELLAAASITLIPSWSETFGLVALESAASGTPVIGSRSSGLLESVAEGQSGILVDSREPREWAEEMSALLDDPDRVSELGTSARAHAERFTWAACATSLLGVYASLR